MILPYWVDLLSGGFLDSFETFATPTLAVYDVGSYECASSYGLVELDDNNQVVDFQEKPDNLNSTLVPIACYAFPGDLLSLFHKYLAGDNNPDDLGWFIRWVQERNAVHAFTFDKPWFDIGMPERYLAAVTWYLDGENSVHREATIENADLRGNVQVMAGAEVGDTILDNAIVFLDATIIDSELRNSLLDKLTHIDAS